ncbi:MAG: hypothetical protein COA67_08265 [Lutibacter sp.]|nr:MAG: hypothetical protein COA67_08265 [Lutibacter sp.]
MTAPSSTGAGRRWLAAATAPSSPPPAAGFSGMGDDTFSSPSFCVVDIFFAFLDHTVALV